MIIMDIKQILPTVLFFIWGCSSPNSTVNIKTIDIETAHNHHRDIILYNYKTKYNVSYICMILFFANIYKELKTTLHINNVKYHS